MDLNEILVFTRVVQAGSFIGASRELGMPKSTVSRKVSGLEARLGARLLQRTTRKLNLTDVGRAYYQYAARVVAEVDEADLAVARMQEAPCGLLRVTMPLSFGYLGPIVAAFLKRYPEVKIEMVCTDRIVQLVEEGFDVAVRAGQLTDSTLIARHLGVLRSFIVASPEFLKKNGEPKTPKDLERFDCAAFGSGLGRAAWKLQSGGKTASVSVRAHLVVNDFDFLHEAALCGLAVTMLPVSQCIEDIRTGRLRKILGDWRSPDVPIHAVYPSARHLSTKVKAFLDHMREQMAQLPGELSPAPPTP
ncbi:MAG TPA: LysR family transcriptional regulator [Rhodospirillales bacterium]|nr:LysR family transcriptional regulator [Rhodospirillales bacterium]